MGDPTTVLVVGSVGMSICIECFQRLMLFSFIILVFAVFGIIGCFLARFVEDKAYVSNTTKILLTINIVYTTTCIIIRSTLMISALFQN